MFAYWDIDWKAAFGEENPRPRKVQLRMLNADDSEHTSLEVEPMAGHCSVTVTEADAEYRAEIGFSDGAGELQVVSRSEAVAIPPAGQVLLRTADFAPSRCTSVFNACWMRRVPCRRKTTR